MTVEIIPLLIIAVLGGIVGASGVPIVLITLPELIRTLYYELRYQLYLLMTRRKRRAECDERLSQEERILKRYHLNEEPFDGFGNPKFNQYNQRIHRIDEADSL